MKKLVLLTVSIALITACKKGNRPGEHEYSIQGVLLNNCEDAAPVADATVGLQVNSTSHGSTQTNSDGSFSFSGTWKEKGGGYGNLPYFVLGGNQRLAILPNEGANLDTIYLEAATEVVVETAQDFSEYTAADTLFIRYSPPYSQQADWQQNSYGDAYMLKYPGPFAQSIDTLLVKGTPHHEYHDDNPRWITTWVNDYQDWAGADHPYTYQYATAGFQEGAHTSCGGLTTLRIEH